LWTISISSMENKRRIVIVDTLVKTKCQGTIAKAVYIIKWCDGGLLTGDPISKPSAFIYGGYSSHSPVTLS
jgi:hypothetical protein